LQLDFPKEILTMFKEFGFVYNAKQEGKEKTTWSIHYAFLSKETIDGTDTSHIKVTRVEKGETKEYECWYNAEWETVKYKDVEGEKTGADASLYGASLQMALSIYCNTMKLTKTVVDEEGEVDDFMYIMKGKRKAGESADLGDG
jgi:hypothetical protein